MTTRQPLAWRALSPWAHCFRTAACALFTSLSLGSVGAQNVTQTFNLRSGWNSIWLDVTPTNSATTSVLAGAPLVSVWTFADRLSAVDFVENLNEPVWNRSRWLRFVPTNQPAAFQNNLATMPGRRAYLLQLSNSFTLRVTGRPAWRPRPWAPDAYNLRGFPVDPAAPPTFLTFFRPSPAHYDVATGQLRKIYRLAATGQWTLVGANELMTYGEAYWVFAEGASDFFAPLDAKLEGGDGLDFGNSLGGAQLQVQNQHDAPVTFSLRDLGAPTPLAYQQVSPTNGPEWVNLSGTFTRPLASGEATAWVSSVRRGSITSNTYASVLEIKDGRGTRLQLPVTADKLTPAEAGAPAPGGTHSLAGLWVGNAAISAVNEVNNATNTAATTPVSSDFNLRLLIHVDTNGVARLLKEVTQLWKAGTQTTNADGTITMATPGRYVLVTEESLFSQFDGATMRDGTQAGRRISTTSYDFPTTPGNNFLALNGSFGGSNALSGTISLPPTHPTNPFRHAFHPDHDNLDERFVNYKAEAYAVQRQIALQFSATTPAGVKDVDYGYRTLAGTYRETVTGLNQKTIYCQGTFRLTRFSDIGQLNQ